MKTPETQIPNQPQWWAVGLRASIETVVACGLVGTVLFWPFVHQYHLFQGSVGWIMSFLAGAAVGLGCSAGIFLPSLALLRVRKMSMTPKELSAMWLVGLIFLVLLGFLAAKGLHGPAYRGKLLLFAVMMVSAIASWIFPNRYSAIVKILQPQNQ